VRRVSDATTVEQIAALDEAIATVTVTGGPRGRRADRGLVAAGDMSGTVRVLDPADPCAVPLAPDGHSGGVSASTWSPGGHVLASAGCDGTVHLTTFGTDATVVDVGRWPAAMAWSPAGDLLAIAAASDVVVVDANGDHIATHPCLPGAVRGLAWADGPGPLAAGTHGAVAWLAPGLDPAPVALWPVTGAARCLTTDPERRRLATGDLAGVVRLTDLAAGSETVISRWEDRIERLAWDRAGTRLAVPDGDEVVVWPLEGIVPVGDEPVRLAGHDAQVSDLAYGGHDGCTLVTGGADGHVVRWVPESLHDPRAIDLGAAVTTVTWSRAAGRFVVGTVDGRIAFVF
jgi:WD40 repeat protein